MEEMVDMGKLLDAASSGDLDLVNRSINEIKQKLGLALISAVRNDDIEMVKCLLKNGADVHIQNDEAIIDAAEYGHLEVLKCLVEQGADIHAQDDLALLVATDEAHYQVCQYLVSLGCDPQKVIDDERNDDDKKQWAIDFVNARDLSKKLHNELLEKHTTKAQQLSNDIESENFSYKTPTTRTARTKL